VSWGKIRRAGECERGAALVEFALILMPLCVLIMGTLELGYRIYAISVVNGALRDAARMASTGQYTGPEIDAMVTNTIHSFRANATVAIVKKSYASFTGVGVAEPVTSGTVASGTYCYQDVNGNGQWDADQGTAGLGNPDDVVYYQVTASYNTLFPFSQRMFGMGPTTTISVNTLVSNEPFAPPVTQVPQTLCVG
jgi:Flp pilus assembly protein TadG